MKSKKIMVAMLLMLSATAANAQQHVQKAFEALLNEKYVEIKTQHSLERDPETGRKEGEMDVYDFELPAPTVKQRQLVKDVEKAFEKDKEDAYSLSSGSYGNNVSLAVGDGKSVSVGLGRIKGSRYIYACFLDKDDPEKKYRYAYAMEWAEKDKKTTVRLAKTYATTQKYRHGGKSIRKVIVNGKEIDVDGSSFSFGSGFPFDNSSVFDSDSIFFNHERSSESWLSEFNTYKNLFLKNPDGTAASHYATSIYKLCKNAKSLEKDEKRMVAREIAKLKTSTNDEFIQQLFLMSIKRLGE